MRFDVITIFPDILDSYINKGMLRLAQKKKLIQVKAHNLRKFAIDKHGTVDDKPYGGGPGQIMMVEPVIKALRQLRGYRQDAKSCVSTKRTKTILLSSRGKKWNQQMAQRFSKLNQIIFICPRYEGHDERIKKFVDEEISIGDYVLTGGELGALVIMDSITRLIPGVLGKADSLKEESHSTPGYLEYPQYTRPETLILSKQKNKKACLRRQARKSRRDPFGTKKQNNQTAKQPNSRKTILRVPKVLLSGHHQKIAQWRQQKSRM